jgi:hypothetical protein
VVNDQRQLEVVVEFSKSKNGKIWQSEIVAFDKKFQLWMSIEFDPR